LIFHREIITTTSPPPHGSSQNDNVTAFLNVNERKTFWNLFYSFKKDPLSNKILFLSLKVHEKSWFTLQEYFAAYAIHDVGGHIIEVTEKDVVKIEQKVLSCLTSDDQSYYGLNRYYGKIFLG